MQISFAGVVLLVKLVWYKIACYKILCCKITVNLVAVCETPDKEPCTPVKPIRSQKMVVARLVVSLYDIGWLGKCCAWLRLTMNAKET
jgi:hypothetical protein